MPEILMVTSAVNLALFTTTAIWAVRTAVTDPSPRLRTLAWSLAAVSMAFVLGAASRLAGLAVIQGWLSGSVGDFLVSDWALAQAIASTMLGVTGLVVARRVMEPIRASERISATLAGRVPDTTDTTALGLTSRELDVLAAIADGKVSDKDIGEALFISPATAGTHVRNIMRKAGVSSRRDLVLLTIPANRLTERTPPDENGR